MFVQRDVETARITMHMAKLFSKFARMHSNIVLKKEEIMPAIMQCLRDREIPAISKREAL